MEFDGPAPEYEWQQVAISYTIEPEALEPIPRTFTERWFSLPWRPWVKTRPSFAYLLRQNLERHHLEMDAMCGITVYHEGPNG